MVGYSVNVRLCFSVTANSMPAVPCVEGVRFLSFILFTFCLKGNILERMNGQFC